MAELRQLTGELAERKCHYHSSGNVCRYLAHSSGAFQCMAVVPFVREEIDRRVVFGEGLHTGSACADPWDDVSESGPSTPPTYHDANIALALSHWIARCTCGWQVSTEILRSGHKQATVLDRRRAEVVSRLTVVKHLHSAGDEQKAKDYKEFYGL